ncbi:MAG: hypothetical protein JXL84_26805 [Deltaproteobacteria bacterium]|nr:hypothetical protein [Deltaproteobacteria bacterium]
MNGFLIFCVHRNNDTEIIRSKVNEMPTLEEHSRKCLELTGEPFEEVHRWLDEFHVRPLLTDHRRHLRRIEWVTPGVVWAMDGTQYDAGPTGKIHLCNVQDLGSRYKFLPLAGGHPVGEPIAEYLRDKCDRYGAPVVLKRDNEGTLNHLAVNEVLMEFFILPLNSPRDYAPHNGAIEESQRELKGCLREKLALAMSSPQNHMAAYAESAVNDMNHRVRPCLNGRTSCQVFFAPRVTPAFNRRQRREIYDSIMEKVETILSRMKQSAQAIRESAWRIAVESWLTSRGHVKPHIKTKVSPKFSPFLAHE